MDNIFDMLLEYTKLGRIVDRQFIEHAVNTLKHEKDVADYAHTLTFKNFSLNKDVVMTYKSGSREVIVKKRGIKSVIKLFNSFDKASSFERLLLINTYILKTVIHELNHADEYKESLGFDKNFESTYFRFRYSSLNELQRLTNTSNPITRNFIATYKKADFLFKLDKIYGQTNLSERLADIKADTDILSLICDLDQDLYETVRYYASSLTNSYIRGFNHNGKISAPTMRYLDDCALMNLPLYHETREKALELAATGSFESRLRFGLPITSEEYHLVDNYAFVRQLLPKKYH